MINLELHQLKMLNAQLAEGTIGLDCPDIEGSGAWDVMAGYIKDMSPEHIWSLTHITEKRALSWLAERLAKDSLVVEVGSFMGCSAAIMAHANPGIQIKSIDLFDTLDDSVRNDMQIYYASQYKDRVDSFLGEDCRRTRDNVAQRLAHYTNIEFIQGQSPDEFTDTGLDNIDVYFEDANHHNPGLASNLNFWLPRVKPGGLVVLHDYRPWLPERYVVKIHDSIQRFPDVEGHVRQLMGQGWTMQGRVRGMVFLTKPSSNPSV